MCFCKRVWHKYDHNFLIVFGIQYFNGGLKFLLFLALQDLLKNYYKLEPSQSQIYTMMIWMPFNFKFVYGVLADSISICGSRKKSWILLWGAVQLVTTSICAFVHFENVNVVFGFILLNSVAACFMDVVVDALMVMQARRDPK